MTQVRCIIASATVTKFEASPTTIARDPRVSRQGKTEKLSKVHQGKGGSETRLLETCGRRLLVN